MINNWLLTSNTDERYTPFEVFQKLDKEFRFTLDPCCTYENKKCAKYYTKQDDWLSKSWDWEVVFMNPPYGREIWKRVKKASDTNGVVVCLLPARTDTKWFHDYIYKKAEIRFIKWRLKFGNSKNSAPFPSMLVIFTHWKDKQCEYDHYWISIIHNFVYCPECWEKIRLPKEDINTITDWFNLSTTR